MFKGKKMSASIRVCRPNERKKPPIYSDGRGYQVLGDPISLARTSEEALTGSRGGSFNRFSRRCWRASADMWAHGCDRGTLGDPYSGVCASVGMDTGVGEGEYRRTRVRACGCVRGRA